MRAQDLSRVQLEWVGHERCSVAGDVLERARASVDPNWSATEAITVMVHIRDAGDGGLAVSFEAQRSSDTVRRTLSVRSCEEARRATALLIALALEEAVPGEPANTSSPAKGGALGPPQAVGVEASERAAAAQTNDDLDSKRAVDPKLVRPSEPEPRGAEPEPEPEPEVARSSEAPAAEELSGVRDRTSSEPPRGPWLLAATAGLEGPVLAASGAVFGASVGVRYRALELDLGVSYGLPIAQEHNTVRVVVNQLGASLAASHWFSFGRFEVAPSATLHFVRLSATLNGREAGPHAWLRAAPGLRLGLWVTPQLALQARVEALVSLTRPSLTTSQGDAAEAPRMGVGGHAGLTWSL